MATSVCAGLSAMTLLASDALCSFEQQLQVHRAHIQRLAAPVATQRAQEAEATCCAAAAPMNSPAVMRKGGSNRGGSAGSARSKKLASPAAAQDGSALGMGNSAEAGCAAPAEKQRASVTAAELQDADAPKWTAQSPLPQAQDVMAEALAAALPPSPDVVQDAAHAEEGAAHESKENAAPSQAVVEAKNTGALTAQPAAKAVPVKKTVGVSALQAAEVAKKKQAEKDEERRKRKEAVEQQRMAVAAKNQVAAAQPAQHAAAAVHVAATATGSHAAQAGASGPSSAAGSVQRLKRAIEARALQEEEKRRKLMAACNAPPAENGAATQDSPDQELKAVSPAAPVLALPQRMAVQSGHAEVKASTSAPAPGASSTGTLAHTAPGSTHPLKAVTAAAAAAKPVKPVAPTAMPPPPPRGTAPAVIPVRADVTPAPSRTHAAASYEISPYKSGSESDDDDARPVKPVPDWARSDKLGPVLYAQTRVDPDMIFVCSTKTCSLEDVFGETPKKRDYVRRGSSGNWTDDRLSWKEELRYKKTMGFAGSHVSPGSA